MGGICGIGNKLCCLLGGCQSRAAAAGGGRSLPPPARHRAASGNAVRGFASSRKRRAALALPKQLRVDGVVVRDVTRVLALRNFATEEAVLIMQAVFSRPLNMLLVYL